MTSTTRALLLATLDAIIGYCAVVFLSGVAITVGMTFLKAELWNAFGNQEARGAMLVLGIFGTMLAMRRLP